MHTFNNSSGFSMNFEIFCINMSKFINFWVKSGKFSFSEKFLFNFFVFEFKQSAEKQKQKMLPFFIIVIFWFLFIFFQNNLVLCVISAIFLFDSKKKMIKNPIKLFSWIFALFAKSILGVPIFVVVFFGSFGFEYGF